jgi:uncharacterized tellurite resistance protein B-like protein
MNIELTPQDLFSLSDPQRAAVLNSLYAALFADGHPEQAEVSAFIEAISRLPWNYPVDALMAKANELQAWMEKVDRDTRTEFMRQTAENVPVELREKLVLTMIAIAAADRRITEDEWTRMASFIKQFQLTPIQIELIRRKIAPLMR